MIIRTQNGTAIFNCSLCSCIFTDKDGHVFLLGHTGELSYELGVYATEDRAKEVIEEIFALIGVQDKYDMPVV